MDKDIFAFKDYKAYLRALISQKPKRGRGVQAALSKAIHCPVSHVSQVLGGDSHFSLEQAEGVNGFFGHTEDEAAFFLTLVQYSRAGTQALKKRLESELKKASDKRLILKDRLGVPEVMGVAEQAQFYSTWIYGAIHVMLSLEKFHTKDAIANHLGITVKRVAEILEFLVSVGLAVRKSADRFEIGTSRIHLGSDSPLISKHHTNWRMRAIQSLESDFTLENLHYSSVVTLSESDVGHIKSTHQNDRRD